MQASASLLCGNSKVGEALGGDKRLRSSKGVVDDVEVTNHRESEGMVQADTIGEHAHCERNDGSAHDRHDEPSGAVAGERAEFGDAQRENAREHDRVEEPDQDDGPHGEVTGARHGNEHEQTRNHRGDAENFSSWDLLQNRRTEEAADHRAEPVRGEVSRGGAAGEVADIRLTEIVDEEAADGNFRANVDENSNDSEDEMAVFPETRGGLALVVLGSRNGRQPKR